jgi:GMP synthase-like glutamine amidotransferase
MKKEILIVKNITRESPGILQDLLIENDITYKIVDLSKGMAFPDCNEFSAVVVLGGPQSANDNNGIMQNELMRIKKAVEAGIPYLGICLGFQLMVKAFGGKVIKSPVKEVGFRDPENKFFIVDLTDEGKEDPIFEGLTDTFKVFHLHGETVELTNEMKLLATGKYCLNQIAGFGSNAYGIQSHFELTPEMFERWINEDRDLLVLDKEQLRNDFRQIKEEYTQVGRKLLQNFLKIAGVKI